MIDKHCAAIKDKSEVPSAAGKLAQIETMPTAGLEVVQEGALRL